jgi:hypothetical protein
MIQEQQPQSIVPLLKSYNACLIFTIISIQAALSFVIPINTGSNIRIRMIALYALIPVGNIPCVVELSKAVNARIEEIGVERSLGFADIKRIERLILEKEGQ